MADNGNRGALDLFPSRADLEHIERLLTGLQFECEEAGWWPGALTITGFREETGALGLLWELQMYHNHLLKESRSRRKPIQVIRVNGQPVSDMDLVVSATEVWPVSWPSFWSVEIERV